MPNKRKDYSGQRFGKLIATSFYDTKRTVGPSNHLYSRWLCRCDCGEEVVIRSTRFGAESRKRLLSCGNCEPHGNRKYSKEESTLRNQYFYHSKSCNNQKWGSLPYGTWKNLVFQSCVACGSDGTPRKSQTGSTVYLNGIDRIDSTKGYIENNVQPMCTTCNKAKSDLTMEDFLNHCKKIVQYNTDTKELKEWSYEGKRDT